MEYVKTQTMTQTQCDAWADRIAAVLRERQEVGAERRRQGREYQRLNSARALARYHSLTKRRSANANEPLPEFTQSSGHWMKEIDAEHARFTR